MVTGLDYTFSGHARVGQHSVCPNSSPYIHHGNLDVCCSVEHWSRWYSHIYSDLYRRFNMCSSCVQDFQGPSKS